MRRTESYPIEREQVKEINMYKTILVPLDGSQRAEAILPHAENLAKRYDAKIIFLGVIESPSVIVASEFTDVPPDPKGYERQFEEVKTYLTSQQENLRKKGIDTQQHVGDGPVVKTIINVAEHLDKIDGISTYYDGCVVFDNTANYYYFVNLEGAVYRSRSVETEVANCAMISITYDNDKEWDFDVVPVSYDPIWGSSEGELEWREVRKDGNFLSRSRFHQAEITLRGDSELERVVLAPAVEAQNISPGESKNIYARSNIPGSTDITEYETKFRTWFRLFE